MTAYDPELWHEQYVAVAGAAAALAGLLFVAVSLNIKEILDSPGLPPLASRTLMILLGQLLLSIFVLVPGQSRVVLGIEITLLGLAMVTFALGSVARGHFPVVKLRWSLANLGVAMLGTLPMLVAGLFETFGVAGGLYWGVVELVAAFAVAIYNAWILLVEIKR